ALRMELGAGGRCGWSADVVPAAGSGAEDEQGVHDRGHGRRSRAGGIHGKFCKAEEVDAKVRLVIEGEDGRQLRARVAARREEAKAALEEGGSSRASFARFLLDVDNL
ncbi:hypothetical protein CFC21_014051, partial [Triticum aestivum]